MLANSSGRVCCPRGLISSSAFGFGISIQTSPGRWLCPNPQNPFFLPGLKGNTPPVGVFHCSVPSGQVDQPPSQQTPTAHLRSRLVPSTLLTSQLTLESSPHHTPHVPPQPKASGEALTPYCQSPSLFERGGEPIGFFNTTDLGETLPRWPAAFPRG